jgi:internalin A
VLEDKSLKARALVRCDVRDRFITVDVCGEQRREYFAVIRKTFHDIHAGFTNFNPTENVPLPDHPDVSVDYEELVGLEKMGESHKVVGKLGRRYSVQQLLNGIESKQERARRNEQLARSGDSYHIEHAHFDQREEHQMTTVNIGDNNTFHGNVVIAEKIEDSFKTVQNAAGLSSDLEKLLTDFIQAAGRMAEAAEQDNAEKIVKYVQTVADEATGNAPDKDLLTLALKRIKEFALKAGDIGTTVLTLSDKLAPLLQLF